MDKWLPELRPGWEQHFPRPINMSEIARVAGMSQGTVYRTLTRRLKPSLRVLANICGAYGLTLDSLCEFVPNPLHPDNTPDSVPDDRFTSDPAYMEYVAPISEDQSRAKLAELGTSPEELARDLAADLGRAITPWEPIEPASADLEPRQDGLSGHDWWTYRRLVRKAKGKGWELRAAIARTNAEESDSGQVMSYQIKRDRAGVIMLALVTGKPVPVWEGSQA